MQKFNFFKKKYVEDNFKSLVKEYKVKYLKYFTVDTESQALKIIKELYKRRIFHKFILMKIVEQMLV